MKTIMNNFVPVYKYAQDNEVPKQTVYRWIREGKIRKEDIKIEEVVTKRIRINNNAQKQ